MANSDEQIYYYEYYQPEKSQEGLVCTKEDDCVPFKGDFKWIKMAKDKGFGYRMVTMLIFDEHLELEGTVDATRLIFHDKIGFNENGSILHRIPNFDLLGLGEKFVLDNRKQAE